MKSEFIYKIYDTIKQKYVTKSHEDVMFNIKGKWSQLSSCKDALYCLTHELSPGYRKMIRTEPETRFEIHKFELVKTEVIKDEIVS